MKKIFLGVLIGVTTSSFLVLCYLLYNFVDEQNYDIEGRQVRAFNKLYNKASNQYDTKQLLDLFKKCTFLDKFRQKNFNFL